MTEDDADPMKLRRSQWFGILIGLGCFLLAAVAGTGAQRQWSDRFPNGWLWEVDTLATRLSLPEDVTTLPPTSVADDPLTVVRRIVSREGDLIAGTFARIADRYTYFDVVTGAILWQSTTTTVVDQFSGRTRGSDTPVYYLFPRNVQPTTYTLANVAHEALPLTYLQTETVLGLDTYVFEYRGQRVDPRPERRPLEGQQVMCFDFELRYWVEPITGEVLQFRQACPGGEWLVDAVSGDRIVPVGRFALATSGDDLARSANRIQSLLTAYRLTTLVVPGLLLGLGLTAIIAALLPRSLTWALPLPPLLRTFRVRIYSVLGVLTLMIGLLIVLAVQTTSALERQSRTVDVAGQIRTYALQQLNSLRQLASVDATGTQDEQFAVRNQLNVTTSTFDRLMRGLREGDRALGLEAPDSEALALLLTDLETRWEQYRTGIRAYMLADPPDRAALLPALDAQSQIVFTYADRTVTLVDTLAEAELANVQRAYAGVAAVVIAVLVLALLSINTTTRGLRQLEQAANRFAIGELSARLGDQPVTEIRRVGQVFNTMAGQLNKSIDDLKHLYHDANAARARAEQSDRVKSAFLASMSHELRTPLNAVINFTRFVADGEVGPVNAEQKEMLTDSLFSAKHLLNLINDVLDMSKIEAGSLTLFLEDGVDLPVQIASAAQAARSLLGDKPVSVKVDIGDLIVPIRADRQRVYQVLLNMVSNACKFTEQGEIVIGVHRCDDEMRLFVKDTGSGIAPEEQESVFTPFRQTKVGLRQAGGGTGLGMPISRSLVEAHGGRMWLENEVGKGSTFFVALPITANARVTAEMLKVTA